MEGLRLLIELAWICEKCGTTYMPGLTHGKCPYCDFEIIITGIDPDKIKVIPKD